MAQILEKDLMQLIQKDFDAQTYSAAELKILQWLESRPENPNAWSYLGYLYSKTGKRLASYTAHKRSVTLDPDNALFLSNFANSHIPIGKAADGVSYLRKAVEIAPKAERYQQNLTYILRDSCNYDEAEILQRQIVDNHPNNSQKQFDLGFVLLHNRKLDEGWQLYNHRPVRADRKALFDQVKEAYSGQSLKGKSLLIIGEQGFGDTILMLRFLDKLTSQGGQISLVSRKPLFPILGDMDVILHDQDNLPQDFNAATYDYAIYMMDLPQIFEKDWLKWPAAPKLTPPQSSRDKIAHAFKPRPQKLKIGIVWSGSVTFQNNHLRATDYTRFLQMAADHPDIQFYSMQKGPRENDILEHGMGSILPIGQKLDDFGDTAAALEHIDMLIMTDSGLAHLAGSQGVPVLNLLNFLHYWMYFPRDLTTPLYPSWRFIRQPSEGDWDFVFNQTHAALTALTDAAQKHDATRLPADAILKTLDSVLTQ